MAGKAPVLLSDMGSPVRVSDRLTPVPVCATIGLHSILQKVY